MAQRYVACVCEPQTTEQPRGIIVFSHVSAFHFHLDKNKQHCADTLKWQPAHAAVLWCLHPSSGRAQQEPPAPPALPVPFLSPRPTAGFLHWVTQHHNPAGCILASWPTPPPCFSCLVRAQSAGCESYIPHDFALDFHVHYINCTWAIWMDFQQTLLMHKTNDIK